MTHSYNRDQHMEYLYYTERIGRSWIDIFKGNTEFYSAAYWDLFTRMWRHNGPVRKTDALGFMTAVKSAHTSGKYLETAIGHGWLIETENPVDARSKLLTLSPEMERRLGVFFDVAVREIRQAAGDIEAKGASSEARG